MSEENPHAGEGPVLLDIGGDVGALIVTMPEHTRGLEVEIRPAGSTAAHRHQHGTGHGHTHAHGGTHHHDHPHDDGQHRSPWPHVGVVERRTPDGSHLSLVYPEVTAGEYELCPVAGDEVVMTATVVGGRISEADWPR